MSTPLPSRGEGVQCCAAVLYGTVQLVAAVIPHRAALPGVDITDAGPHRVVGLGK